MNQVTQRRRPSRQPQLPPLRERFATESGAQAAWRLFAACWRHDGGNTLPVAAFLVGLYNGRYASADLAWLSKWTDDATFEDLLATMRWIRANSQYEIHHIFAGDGGETMLALMQRFELWPQSGRED
ncbi:MAG: hypothetical protein AB1704_26270 [Pseudomonadota bacterium]|jgi:hypothetical protein|uniref:DUF7673 family protein n=1 Tax=Burkholderiaceae TaxID=119060 RepID=UPI0010F7887B|nr:hypothetical protein [Burkholderia sp. 4M9327F10]